jgi:integrase
MGVIVRQKTKGKGKPWWVFVSHNKKRTSSKVGDKPAAEEVASIIRAKLQFGEFSFEDPKAVPTFGEYAGKWLRGYVKINLRESTVEEYECILKLHILPVFKDQEISDISKAVIRDHLISKLDGLSKKRVNCIMSVMSNVFELAVEDDVIESNPTSKVSKRLFSKNGYKAKTIGQRDVFTFDELELYLDTCRDHFKEFYPCFLTAARTGIRLGELLALKWDDIDFNSGYIWVKRSYRRGRTTRPKNGKTRKVDMSKQLGETLAAHLTAQKRVAMKQGAGEVTGLVFDSGRNNRERFIQRLHQRTLKKAGLRHMKFHGLRHTFASHLLSMGVSPYYVSQQLGHSSISITCDVYGSHIRSDENRHVDMLDSLPIQNDPQLHPGEGGKSQPAENTGTY